MTNSNKNLVLFASGGGSNALKIIQYFNGHPTIKVVAIVCNNENAGIVEKAKAFDVPCAIISKAQLKTKDSMSVLLSQFKADYLILAGFLLLMPPYLIKLYENRILNIHPSLLPKFGGKGMYGINIHKAVIAAKEKESGITIHLVNEEYDKGRILFQASIPVDTDIAEDLAAKILILEHHHFSLEIEKYVLAIRS